MRLLQAHQSVFGRMRLKPCSVGGNSLASFLRLLESPTQIPRPVRYCLLVSKGILLSDCRGDRMTQCLQVIAQALVGSPKHNAALVRDLAKLASEFGGHLDLSYHSTTTSFRWRCNRLVDRDDLLKVKVGELKTRYHDTIFDLFTESTSHSAEAWLETFH